MSPTGPSLNLSWKELSCHDEFKTPYPVPLWLDRAIALAAEFESLRFACGLRLGSDPVPITVLSAYRTPQHNGDIGGAGRSQHVEGRALDIAPPRGMDVEEFGQVCLEQARARGIIRGVGVYGSDNHVHIDLRLETALATWRG
jgi:hypothetical protein